MKPNLFLLAAILFIPTLAIFAAPGDLDPTFNGTGNLLAGTLDRSGMWGAGPTSLLAVQPNGKILASSSIVTNSDYDIIISRFNASGTLDVSFGTGGIKTVTGGAFAGWGSTTAMALQPDGKILVTGYSADSIPTCHTARFNADGGIDTSFNGTGVIMTSYNSCRAFAIGVQPDGKIVVGGAASGVGQFDAGKTAWLTIRYNADGTPDTGYGPNGISSTALIHDKFGFVSTLFIQPDGKILLCGTLVTLTTTLQADFGILRFNPSGSIDTAFGSEGLAYAGSPTASESLGDAAMQPDGKIVFAGSRNADFTVTRVNSNGTLDTSFGTNGFTVTTQAARGTTRADAVAVQSDGKVLVGGVIRVNGQEDFGVARFNANGTLDQLRPAGKGAAVFGKRESVIEMEPLWGSNGVAIAGYPDRDDMMHSMALDPAGRLVISGTSYFFDGEYYYPNLALARFQGDASPYAEISGTVRSAGGLPIRNAYVELSGGSLTEPVQARTNNLGIYLFTGLPVTETYKVSASAKRFRFANGERTTMLNSSVQDFDFTANQ